MSFDAWVVGFGLSRVLIELNLVESPWAYGVLAGTILIDVYLLYIFFTGRKTSVVNLVGSAVTGDRQSGITSPRDPFGPLGTLFGYVIGLLGIAMLIYAIRLPP